MSGFLSPVMSPIADLTVLTRVSTQCNLTSHIMTASVSGRSLAGSDHAPPFTFLSLAAALCTDRRIHHHCVWGPARGGGLVPSLGSLDPDATDPAGGFCHIL